MRFSPQLPVAGSIFVVVVESSMGYSAGSLDLVGPGSISFVGAGQDGPWFYEWEVIVPTAGTYEYTFLVAGQTCASGTVDVQPPPTETPTPTPCVGNIDFVDLTAEDDDGDGIVTLTWTIGGGCPPISGTITGTFVDETEPDFIFDIPTDQRTGQTEHQAQCGPANTVVYVLTTSDDDSEGLVDTETVTGDFVCN